MTLVHHVAAELERLAPGAGSIVVAVSGGHDSVALLRLLVELAQGRPLKLQVAHLDHGLRDASAEDAEFVERLAGTFDLPFHGERIDVGIIARRRGWNLSDAARRLRYDFLARTAKAVGADAIATGHTLDDQAETVFMQLTRGAAYLSGMPAKRGRLVRPLLGISRSRLEAYLESVSQPYRDDPTNVDTRYTRAWIRHVVMPELETRYPRLKQIVGRFAAVQQELADYFDCEVEHHLHGNAASLASLRRAHPALQRHLISTLIRRAGVTVQREHVETIRQAVVRGVPRRVSLPRNHVARLAYDRLEIVPQSRPPLQPRAACSLPPEVDARLACRFPDLIYRSRRPGDRIVLPGGTKKLSDLLIDRKIPREDRDQLPVLASGDDVLWVQGIATDQRVSRAPGDEDRRWMHQALQLAQEAASAGEVPVGAVIVKARRIIGRGRNATESTRDPTEHAELRAIRQAAAQLGDWRLSDCTLYVTLEPCPMCLGAMLAAHLPRVVYGARNYREGALGSVVDLLDAPWKRRIEVRGGVAAKEAQSLLGDFFTRYRLS